MQMFPFLTVVIFFYCNAVEVEGWIQHVRTLTTRRNTHHIFPIVSLSFQRRDSSTRQREKDSSISSLPKNTGGIHYQDSHFYLPSCKRSFSSVLHLSSSSSSNNKNTPRPPKSPQNYSDDFFGLVFLGSTVGLHDAVFATTFLILSFVGAITSRQNSNDLNDGNNDTVKLLPGIVALTSLGLSLVLKLVLVKVPVETIPSAEPAALAAEAVVCLASFAYTTFLSRNSKEQGESIK
eukprot:scaffold220_cov169-Amphora_coffeaeformis.AAC.34